MNSASFQEYLSGLSVTQLREHQNLLNSALSKVQDFSKSFRNIDSPVLTQDVNNYVDYFDSFLDSDSIQLLLSECLSMGFSKKSPNVSVQNKFVSLFSEPYCWNSAQGPVINNPLNMDDYPTIRKVMGAINEQHGAKLNSCLVSYYKNGHVRARLHCDDEAELDHTQPIAVVSLGAVRNVEFVDNKQESFRTTARTLKPSNGSLYLMRAGCQQAFRHRVRMNKRVKDFRISISFRSFIPPGSVADLVHGPAPISPLCSDASFATCGSQASSLHTPTSPISPVVVKPVRVLLSAAASQAANARNKFSLRLPVPIPAENVADSRTVNEVSHPVSKPTALPSASLLPDVEGYSPFPQTPYTTSSAKPAVLDRSSERVCVIFGTSITEHVDGGLMSRGDRTVVNVSSSGADIDDIRQMAEDFHHENLSSIHKIDKIIVSVGTNDVKFYNSRVRNMSKDLRPKLISLVKLLKQLFPSAQVHFQTMLPIKITYNYTAESVHQFNNLLLDICTQYNCFFFDCFSRFLDNEGIFYNRTLFRDKYHLNNAGLKVFCRALKFLVYSNVFNPHPRYSIYPRMYPC